MKNGELPAFVPGSVPNNQGNYEPTYGITKREYFAAMAMQGLVTYGGGSASEDNKWHDRCAKESVQIADELLKALEQ